MRSSWGATWPGIQSGADMATFDEARRLALGLPEATEEPHFERTSFRIKGRIFATAPPRGTTMNVFVGEHEVQALASANPGAFAALLWGKRLSGVQVNLANIDAAYLGEVLAEAWLKKAPKRLAASFRAGQSPSADASSR